MIDIESLVIGLLGGFVIGMILAGWIHFDLEG